MIENIDTKNINEEMNFDLGLRPKYLSEYIGQKDVVNNLNVFMSSAKKRQECLDHVLLYGAPGLGKTTLAFIIANEMKGKIRVVSAPSIEKTSDMAVILSQLNPGDILFIDEIHRLPNSVEEVLYGAMEDFNLSILIKESNVSKILNIPLPPFTLVGATTNIGALSNPLRTRFLISLELKPYSNDELSKIIERSAKLLDTKIDKESCDILANRSRYTPRIANKLLRRVRDYALYENLDFINKEITLKTLDNLKIDELGLTNLDVKYLNILKYKFNGGPVGIETLSSVMGEDKNNILSVIEPFLLDKCLITRTPRGRKLTEKGYSHLENYHHSSLIER